MRNKQFAVILRKLFMKFNPSHPVDFRKLYQYKINLNFYFHTSFWCLGFMKVLTFEAPQRSVKMKM